MMFIVAFILSFSAIVGCQSNEPPAASSEVNATSVANGPNAWQTQASMCTATESAKDLHGSTWTCAEDYFYACLMALHGLNDCETISCGETWLDWLENIVWINSDTFTHMRNGQPSQCNRVKPVAGTVHTIGFEWWKSIAGSYTTPSMDRPEEIAVKILFGEQASEIASPYKTTCYAGENHITVLRAGVDANKGTVWCIPSPSTGYDLHQPSSAQSGKVTYTAYALQSDTGFADCPGGGRVKIVVKEDDGEGASFSYTLCQSK